MVGGALLLMGLRVHARMGCCAVRGTRVGRCWAGRGRCHHRHGAQWRTVLLATVGRMHLHTGWNVRSNREG
jgi:hypothetical protein